jgi:hypothetical protein
MEMPSTVNRFYRLKPLGLKMGSFLGGPGKEKAK